MHEQIISNREDIMFEEYGIVVTFGVVLFWLAVASGILYLVGVCLKFERDRLQSIKEILKTFIASSLAFLVVGWLTQ